jgi:hypothetical protein
MKQITISVPDGQFAFFMQLVKALNFVEIKDQETLENSLTPSQQETWKNVKAGFEEYKLTEAGKRPARPIEAILSELDD